MRNCLFIVFFTLLLWPGVQLIAQVRQVQSVQTYPVRVAVKLVDKATGRPVPYASIKFKSQKKGLRADSNGFFSVVVTAHDTLEITSLGYYPLFYTKDPGRQTSYYTTLELLSKIYELAPVQVLSQRAKNRDNMMLRWEYRAKSLPKIWIFYQPTGEPPPDPDITSPISFLYDQYSRRGKARRKLRDMVADRAHKKWLAQKYNAAKVQRWIGLEGEELEEFMRFCAMPEFFLEQASEYEIIEKTFRCLQDFDNREEK